MPLFSVIIPTYNRVELLKSTLASVRTQTFTDYELIVVDDGSTDGTREWLVSQEGWLRVATQENHGPGAARNLGAQQAQGDYVAFLDSDDLWFPWTLGCFASLIHQHGQPAILGAKLTEFSDETQLAEVEDASLQAEVFADYFASHRAGYFVGAGMSVIRREAFLQTGGYTDQPINAEDHDLILRMGNARGFVQVRSPVTLGWRRHAGTATTNLHRSVAGSLHLIEQERRGTYPDGIVRERERWQILTRHVRPVALECLLTGRRNDAWQLYRATFRWHLALGRWKFLAGFPVKAMMRLV